MSHAVLSCTGLDKAEGSVAREVAILLAEETGAEIICPVVLNRTPARYKDVLARPGLIVVDGCATKCASKLAGIADVKPSQKVLVSEGAKASGSGLEHGLRLGPEGLALARRIVDDLKAAQAAETPEETDRRRSETREGDAVDVEFDGPKEFITVVHDKFEFRIPATGFLFNENDVWVQVAGTHARVGISDYMQQQLTDITYVDPPKLGAGIEQFGEVGEVESTKATFELVSPVSGTVVRVNGSVEDIPESINEDPYGSWIVELELTSWEEDQALLIDGPGYAADVKRKAEEY